MIKNIVFDLGGVLIDFNPKKAMLDAGLGEERAARLLEATIFSYLWVEMDRGFWPEELIIDTMVEDHPELEDDIRAFFDDKLVPLDTLVKVKQETNEWLKSLKNRGYNIYLLSNYPKGIFSKHWPKYDFKQYVDGKIVSGFVGQMKSDQDIYKILMDTFNLKPEECVFIDDHKENIVAAKQLGMQGIQYTDFATTSMALNELLESKKETIIETNLSDKNEVERWGIFELTIEGSANGNPFLDNEIKAEFKNINISETVKTYGFYDGDGKYKIRFMPSDLGVYNYRISGNFLKEDIVGAFSVCEPKENNHGPVHVANQFHFAYEDGTAYYPIGTTCYVWELQSEELQQKTLENLEKFGFNKIRFCIFPKHYDYNLKEPPMYPFPGTPMDSSILTKENFWDYAGKTQGNDWDFTRFNVEYFRHIEDCIYKLREIGVEADLILFHPYDRWGFSMMGREADLRYIKYIIARFGAFRNVWWSLANEYDIIVNKSIADWEAIAQCIVENDAYHHLRSIHNCVPFYDHNRPWVTHCSIQRQDLYKTAECTNEWRAKYKKPIVLDEIAYEGNIQHGWGNISGEEMLRRFWEAACRGGYAGHGETYYNQEDILWWSHGGELHGESHKRFKFLYDILQETPGLGLKPYDKASWDDICAVPESFALEGTYYLYYYSFMRPSFREFKLDANSKYDIYVIDTWEMTKTYAGQFSGKTKIDLPGKQYMAIQIKRVD